MTMTPKFKLGDLVTVRFNPNTVYRIVSVHSNNYVDQTRDSVLYTLALEPSWLPQPPHKSHIEDDLLPYSPPTTEYRFEITMKLPLGGERSYMAIDAYALLTRIERLCEEYSEYSFNIPLPKKITPDQTDPTLRSTNDV